jgi:hypothetical protein
LNVILSKNSSERSKSEASTVGGSPLETKNSMENIRG